MSAAPIDSPQAAFRAGVRTAFSGAGLALISSFTALGALMGESGFSLLQAVGFSLFGFALPGQLLAAELHAHGASLLVISVTVWLVNARLLPMTIVLLPLLVHSGEQKNRFRDMLIAHLVAVTSWVCFLASYHDIAPPLRRYYYVIVGGLLWLCAALASVVGFYLGAELPRDMLIALLFLNPAYFLCMMLKSLTKKANTVAFFGGALLLPLLHQLSPEWDILICGLVAGLVSYYVLERKTSERAGDGH